MRCFHPQERRRYASMLSTPEVLRRTGGKPVKSIIYDEETIAARVRELGAEITRAYPEGDLLILGLLKGSFIFLSDLVRTIERPIQVDFLVASSYGDNKVSSGTVRLLYDPETRLEGKHILLVEDIIDTGKTLQRLMTLLAGRKPGSLAICALLALALFQMMSRQRNPTQEFSYTEFSRQLDQGNIARVEVFDGKRLEGDFRAPVTQDGRTAKSFTVLLPVANSESFIKRLEDAGVPILAKEPKGGFADVAGADEAKVELQEIIEFLKDPQKFTRLGGRLPKGALLVGPPGTGKTLLAKAVAGEAGRPFFSMSGSDFVEMFVGVGASRVRDLFEQGKAHAPCIIFIDEIDAVGRHRGAGLGGGHDRREQTLNQLLVEMDGFESNDGVILIAATNRPDVLDPALLRPGRFDRRVVVNRPDVRGREEILRVHTKKTPLGEDVNLDIIARG